MIYLQSFISTEEWTSGQVSSLVISIVSVACAIVPSIIALVLNNRMARNTLYANTVSRARIEWIENIRKHISELVAFCAEHETLSETECNGIDGAYQKIKAAILMRLSPMSDVIYYQEKSWAEAVEYGIDSNGKKLFTNHRGRYACDGDLIEFLNSDYLTVRANIDKVVMLTTTICKREWDSIKAESGCRDIAEINASIEKYKTREDNYHNKKKQQSQKK